MGGGRHNMLSHRRMPRIIVQFWRQSTACMMTFDAVHDGDRPAKWE
jgi:hypothetical protein